MSQPSNEARILLALRALQNNPKLRLRRAATIYKVGYSTLRDRRNGIQSRSDWVPKSRKLSDLEEQTIVQFLLDLDSRGFPARLRFVEEIANSLLADRDASPVGKRWAHNFVKRQPELKTRLFRRYDYQRAKCEDPTIIRGWFRLVQNTIAKYSIRSDDIWNFDETGFMMGLIMAGMAVTGSERQGRPKSVQPGNREWITVIQAINAEGQSIAPFIIGAGQYHLANWYRESNLPADWVIATSQNGWTNNELGLEWLKHFDRFTTNRSTGPYRLLILDGHESHHSADFERYCKENKIITLCMPAHASHLLQPLDIGCFAVLKKAYGQEIEHLIRCSITHISKTEFFPAFYAAFKATFTESNIRGGFRGAGLAPLDPETVISKLDVQLRTPTPPGEYGIRSDDIWNFNETGFMIGVISSGIVNTSSERRGRPKLLEPENREWVTVIQAINAEGQAIDPFIVVAGQYHLANWYRESNLPASWAIATTQNGWTDNETGLEWLKHFDRCTINRSTGPYRLLILDGHESHHSADFQIYCEENNTITLCMPPHSSHLLHPLDVGCFGPLKKAYGREIEQLIRRSITHISKTEFFPAFYAAFQLTMTEANIKWGFRGAGLVTFDPEVVISKLDVQLRTPTPVEEVVQQSQSWTSRTPRTVLEAGSQSEYLQRGIRRHHNSSPESIFEALRCLEKGTKAVMHKVALLAAENRDLR
ncbi:hypothetical protein FOZG_17848 [Fusarium oxysporum Fo47]|uniref:HTH CENPB-type domain-containing protein n=1 Tax=Fusarium oxysporum Fo47 TaxID=660027 RepID=W9JFI7_FUSOX|nr:hypothetical protein FOZG_17848 [Fusarium oxysporum Fo47]